MPFEHDPIFLTTRTENTRTMNSSPNYHPMKIAIALIVALSLAIGTLLLVQSTIYAASGSTAADRPDWQDKNTIQNMYENYIDWVEYTDGLDTDFFEGNGDPAFMGEAFSVTAELLMHYDEQGWPSGDCAQDFLVFYRGSLDQYMHFYGAWYYNMTTSLGEPIDIEHIAEQYEMYEEYYSEDGISAKCWNKLDA